MFEFDPKAPICIECGSVAKLTSGKAIYPHRPDLYSKHFYKCNCGAYVGCHPDTTNALGTPAGAKTRNARKAVHAAFDPLWKNKLMKRSYAYQLLAEALEITGQQCHVSWFDAEQCAAALEAVKRIKEDKFRDLMQASITTP